MRLYPIWFDEEHLPVVTLALEQYQAPDEAKSRAAADCLERARLANSKGFVERTPGRYSGTVESYAFPEGDPTL